MATANERRLAVRDAYRKFIGRNHYSQPRRNYCLKKYSDGKYYSDCSSSVSYAYQAAGEGFGILNTAGMWTSKKMTDVPVAIKNGVIQNPEVLRVGDMLLFAGNDTSRKACGYVGHVEMVGEIAYRPASSTEAGPRVSGGSANEPALSPADAGRSVDKIQLYGHGSGLAKKHEMNAYCRTRYNTRSSTPLKRRLLIRVRRAIQDDAPVPAHDAPAASEVEITGGAVNVRSGPGAQYPALGAVKKGARLRYQGLWENVGDTPWYLVAYVPSGSATAVNAWVSGRYARTTG